MNARKAVLADNPELILRVLQLRFDESLSYPRISAQTGISKTVHFFSGEAISQVFTDWPLSGEYLRATGPGSVPGAIPFSPDSDSACENRENPPEPIFTGV
ncbi:hypothetical protein ECDEC13E_4470 [Escherichia coli DEC13E]|nr:hypothetical protein ECDEC13E_4470 [Escherichia coli DEC13E]